MSRLVALLLALLASLLAGDADAREEEVEIRGCVIDIENEPVENARVELVGTSYRGGVGYAGHNSSDTTASDGTFKVMMKKGAANRKETAQITIWNTLAGRVSRNQGGTAEGPVENFGVARDLTPCFKVTPSYFIVVPVSGKNGQPRPDTWTRQGAYYAVKLRLDAVNPLDPANPERTEIDVMGPGTREFQPWFPQGSKYIVTIVRQPDDERCDFETGGEAVTGVTGGSGVKYPRRHMLLPKILCKESATPPTVGENAVPPVASLPRRGSRNSILEEGVSKPAAQGGAGTDPGATQASPQDRFAQMRAGCSSAADTCNKICLGVGAIGIFSALRGGNAGDANAQLEACSNRCDSEKSACDQKIAEMEQPAAPLEVSASGAPAGNAPPAGTSNCKPDEALLGRYAQVAAQWQREIGNPMKAKPVTLESVRAEWQDLLGREMNSSPRSLEDLIQQRKAERERNNWENDPVTRRRMIGIQGALQLKRMECLLQEAKAREAATVRTASRPAPQAARSGLPFQECQRQENASDIGARLTGLPSSDTVLKSRGIIAASDFMIATYSQCLPDQRAQQQVAQYRKVRADTLRTCQQVSNNPPICERSPF